MPDPKLSDDYLDGGREGVCAFLVAFMSRNSGGFVEAPGRDGVTEQFLPVGFLFDIAADLRLHPQAPKAKHDAIKDGAR